MLPSAVADYLDAHHDRLVGLLTELASIPSIANVKDEPDSCGRAAAWLANHLRGMGLEPRLIPTAPGDAHDRPYVFAECHAGDDLPTVLIYCHYDVQPADPLDEWASPPFEPQVRDGCLWGRGVSDDKGQIIANLMALEAWQQAGGLPVNVKLLFDGEEEIGSPHAEAMLQTHGDLLQADAVLVADGQFYAPGRPSVTYAMRGLAAYEIIVRGPLHDVHSGQHGGALTNPVNALARMVAALHDAEGRVTLPGFYDDVQPASDAERSDWQRLGFDEAEYARSLGVEGLGGGERGFSAIQRRWERPTLDCNGIYGGYAGPGSKTIIPAMAGAKITCRLVPNQDPAKIADGLRQFVRQNTPPGVTAELTVRASAPAMMVPVDSPAVAAVRAGLAETFGAEPLLVRMGASIPICAAMQRMAGLQPIITGCGLPSDGIHGPNEHTRLDQSWTAAKALAAILGEMATRLRC